MDTKMHSTIASISVTYVACQWEARVLFEKGPGSSDGGSTVTPQNTVKPLLKRELMAANIELQLSDQSVSTTFG